jgi:hypothetical protein
MGKHYKIFETMHDRQTYYLVFDSDNNVIYKTSKRENADNFIQSIQRAEKDN